MCGGFFFYFFFHQGPSRQTKSLLWRMALSRPCTNFKICECVLCAFFVCHTFIYCLLFAFIYFSFIFLFSFYVCFFSKFLSFFLSSIDMLTMFRPPPQTLLLQRPHAQQTDRVPDRPAQFVFDICYWQQHQPLPGIPRCILGQKPLSKTGGHRSACSCLTQPKERSSCAATVPRASSASSGASH